MRKGFIAKKIKHNSLNNYGFTKIEGENLIKQLSKSKKINYVIFRYFNVAGDFGLNYVEKDPKNIFPVLCSKIKNNEVFNIFGNDYKTFDKTPIRDYIHIKDLVNAHIKSINYKQNEIFNLGAKKGISVLEIIKKFEEKIKRKINFKFNKRRDGDCEKCLANCSKVKKLLKWEAKYNLDDIVEDYVKIYNLK